MFGLGKVAGAMMGRGGNRSKDQGNQGGMFSKLIAAQQAGQPQGMSQVPQGPPPNMQGPLPGIPNYTGGQQAPPAAMQDLARQAQEGARFGSPPQGPPPQMMGQGMGPSPEVMQQLMQRRQQMMASAGQGMQGQGSQGMMRPQGY